MLTVRGRYAVGIGIILILAGVLSNEWMVSKYLSSDGVLRPGTRQFLFFLNISLVSIGLLVIAYKKIDLMIPLSIVIIVLIGLGLLELLLITLLNVNPAKLPVATLNIVRPLYWESNNLIQYVPNCARHDSDLGYTLKPGECTFSTSEFSTEYYVNSAGLRDDESSLHSPEIVVLGDSQAMGWGVEQEDTFANLLEKKLNSKVLNAGISSYGTAREVMLLNSLDTKNLKTIILQYSDNDFRENLEFTANIAFSVMGRSEYECVVEYHHNEQQYYIGKYTVISLSRAVPLISKIYDYFQIENNCGSEEQFIPRRHDSESPELEAESMLSTLLSSKLDLTETEVIVIQINAFGKRDQFVDALNKLVDHKKFDNFVILSASNILDVSDYFYLDGHMNTKGHSKVADTLVEYTCKSQLFDCKN